MNMDDEEDVFSDVRGFRIKINREQKVVNHLEDRVENNNLLFYNFNAYKQSSQIDKNLKNYSSSTWIWICVRILISYQKRRFYQKLVEFNQKRWPKLTIFD